MVEAVELSEKDIETLREAVDGCGGPSYTQALAILDRLSPPAPEVDEATRIAREFVARFHARAGFHKEAERAREGKYDKDGLADIAYLRTALSELIASKDAEIEEWKAALRNAHDLIGEADNRTWKAESELAALRAENERLKGRDMGACAQINQLREIIKAAERNTAEPAKETTVSYDPNYKCPSCGVAIGMLHEPDCALMLSRTAESAKTHVWPATHDDACSEIKGTETTPGTNVGAVEVTQADRAARREIIDRVIDLYHITRTEPDFVTFALSKRTVNCLFDKYRTEAEARGRRTALEGVHVWALAFPNMYVSREYLIQKIEHMMTEPKP